MTTHGRAIRTAAVLVAVLAVAGCSGASTVSKETAGEFVVRELGYAFKGQSSRQYAVLIPAQRAVVTETQFDEYARTDVYPAGATAMAVETYPDATDIAGTSLRRLRATAVTVKITGGGLVVTESMHAYLVGGQWYWAMTPVALHDAQAGLTAPGSPLQRARFLPPQAQVSAAGALRRRTQPWAGEGHAPSRQTYSSRGRAVD